MTLTSSLGTHVSAEETYLQLFSCFCKSTATKAWQWSKSMRACVRLQFLLPVIVGMVVEIEGVGFKL